MLRIDVADGLPELCVARGMMYVSVEEDAEDGG